MMDTNTMVNMSMASSLASSLSNSSSMSGFPNSSLANSSSMSGFPNSSLANSSSMAGFPNSSIANASSMSGFPSSILANSSSMTGFSNNTSMASDFTNMGNPGSTNSSAFGQKYTVDQMSWNTQFGLSGRKGMGELSPGSRSKLSGLPSTSQTLPTQGQQAFNIQMPKHNRKSGGFFGEDDDPETSMYMPSTIFRPDNKDGLTQSQSPSNPAVGFGNNFYSQGGLNSFPMPQRQGPISGSGTQFQRNLTPTSLGNQSFTPGSGILQNSPNRGVITAIGQHRMINSASSQQAPISALQKRPIGSGLQSSSGPISNLASSFGFPSRSESSQMNFDPAEFPSLGNQLPPQSSMSGGNPRNYGMVKTDRQDQTPEFQIVQEDFPALPGAQSTLSMFVSDPQTAGSTDPSKKQHQNLISGSSYEQALNNKDKFPNDKQGSGPPKGVHIHADGRVTNIPQGMVADQFGMVGLLTFIRSAEMDNSLVALAPGMDLTTLGLNLNSPENLYSTFQSPWVDLPCRPQDIDFHVPWEYMTNIYIRDKLSPIKLNRYGEDLLFFLFYMNGGDVLQLAAAAELYNRDWRYHKDERVWLTRPPGVEPIVNGGTYERGTYYFFDVQNWRKVPKEFHLEYEKLETRPTLPSRLYYNPNQPVDTH
ncbi:CCR4-NOT transcription complex subunit 2-like isoform X2 [Mya arenaria]|uniref:CCR4-NOT transcription complex subunit 2-like isoform X2 n=1 Tax=Mya arenaria TaxID=6604 RepID=UPI0022E6046E|nr:CCR4-NOT transcription complex subunit 2-like isoform X2 [Mya arenaria]